MSRFYGRAALSVALTIAFLFGASATARADHGDHDDWDHDGRHEHHDHGEHRGWYKHHDHDGPEVYYAPPPVYVAPAPPPPVVVAPAPVYVPPSVNIVVPLHIH